MELRKVDHASIPTEMDLPLSSLWPARLLEMLAYAEQAERRFLGSGMVQEAEIMGQVASILRHGLAH